MILTTTYNKCNHRAMERSQNAGCALVKRKDIPSFIGFALLFFLRALSDIDFNDSGSGCFFSADWLLLLLLPFRNGGVELALWRRAMMVPPRGGKFVASEELKSFECPNPGNDLFVYCM